MPDVTAEMSDASFWAEYHDGYRDMILTQEEIQAFNQDTFLADGTFGIHDVVTRSMVADALYAAEKSPKTVTHCFFRDVGEAHPSRKAITWAVENGVMSGYDENTFGASDVVTREQLAAALWRYAQYKGYDVSEGEEINILSYNDAFDISDYAIPAVQWACGAGILNGDDMGNLNPDGTAQKVHMAQILMKFLKS